jgi:hypothetical protein
MVVGSTPTMCISSILGNYYGIKMRAYFDSRQAEYLAMLYYPIRPTPFSLLSLSKTFQLKA